MRTMRVLAGVCFLWCATLSRAGDLYVGPDGNDTWSGALARPNAEKGDGPLASLERAREVIRQRRAAGTMSDPVTVHIRAGTYFLSKTFTLGKEDSGQNGKPVTWRGYENDRPVLVGGKPVGQFSVHQGKILKADVAAQGLKGVYFRQMLFDGQRQHLARYPNFDPANPYGGGWAYADGKPVPMYAEVPGEDKRTLKYKLQDERRWARPEESEVMVFPRYNWWNNIVPVKSVDRETRTMKLARDCSYPIRPTDRYYVRNLIEELDAPGEWYLDKQTWTLYFIPPREIKAADVTVYVPTTRTILEIGAGASNIVVRNMILECAEGTAVVLKDASDCVIAASVIRHVGDYGGSGVAVSGGKNNGVVGNDISYTGSNGVSLSGGDRITLTPAGHYAENNYIHHVGVFYGQGVGVAMSGCGSRASHNLIHDGPRMGIMFGGNNLVIEYNHIRHVNLETADTGAIYTGGRDWLGSRGTVIRYNYFHDILGYGQENGKWVSPHYSWGVYLDDNTGGVDVIGNIVVGCERGGIHLHNGRDNLVENNIFIDGKMQQIECNGWTPAHRYWVNHLPSMIKGYESVADQAAWKTMRNMDLHPSKAVLNDGTIMSGNVFQRNISVWHDAKAKYAKVNQFSFAANKMDQNLIWNFGQPIKTGQSMVKDVVGENLAPNASFEEGEDGKMPADWRWQHRPNNSAAAQADAKVASEGKRSLRIEPTVGKDAKGSPQYPTIVSKEFPMTPGKTYRLRAKVKADKADTRFAISAQSHISKVYFWHKEQGAVVGPDWRQVELVCRVPAAGESGYNAAMKAMAFRLDLRSAESGVWVDEVSVYEAEGLDEWHSWQMLGMDKNSVVADPLFENLEKGDYRLKPNSPALKLGFKPIPVEKIGPYADPLRASWPIVETPGAREKPLVSEHR